MLEELGGPDLVLADLGDHESAFRQNLLKRLEDLLAPLVLAFDPDRKPFFVGIHLIHPPIGGNLLVDSSVELLQNDPDIPDDSDGGGDVLVDLRRVHIDVDNVCSPGERGRFADDPVAEARADHNQQVAHRDDHVGDLRPVHSDHPRIACAGRRNRSDPHHRSAHRSIDLFDELGKLFARPSPNDSPADKTHRPLSTMNKLKRGAERLFADPIRPGFHRLDDLTLILGVLDRYILRHIDQDGARPALLGDLERQTNRLGKIVHILDDEVVLRHRHCDSGDIDFLEGILPEKGNRHVPGDRHDRHAVHIGGGDSRHQIGRPRSAGCEHHPDLAG